MYKRNIIILEKKSFSKVLQDTFDFLAQNISVIAPSLLFFAAPLVVILGILVGLYNASSYSILSKTMPDSYLGSQVIRIVLFMIAIMIVNLAANIIIVIIACESVILASRGYQSIIMYEDIKRAIRRDFFLILRTFIGGFVVIFIAMIFFIIPAIYFSVVISLMPVIRMAERKSFFSALEKSMKLLLGNWWMTAALIFVMTLIAYMAIGLLGIPNMVLGFLVMLHNIDVTTTSYRALFILTNLISQFGLIFLIIVQVAIAMQYYSLVEKKEGRGLIKRIEEASRSK